MAPESFATSVWIAAPPDKVFRYFVEPEAMVRWMGDYAVLDARPGGEFTVDINGRPVRGSYVEVDPPGRLVLTWGFAGSDDLPPGASTVEVTLSTEGAGTRVDLTHRGLPKLEGPQHATGWAHFLTRLAVAAGGGDPGRDPWAVSPTE